MLKNILYALESAIRTPFELPFTWLDACIAIVGIVLLAWYIF